jgi:D-alanine-D-alanine ligase
VPGIIASMSTPAVVFGGPSDEHDISILTGLQVARALGDVHCLYWSKQGEWFETEPGAEAADFVAGAPRKSKQIAFVPQWGRGFESRRPLDISAVVVCCHGGPGEDGTLQGLLELAGLRYTGTGREASGLGMDKFVFGAAMSAQGLPALSRVLVTDQVTEPFTGPYIVKPRFGGSSIGIEVAKDWPTVLALRSSSHYMADGAVVEPFLEQSRDLQVGVRTYPELQLSAIEEPMRAGTGIYSYDQKYLAWGGEVSGGRQLPAEVEPILEKRLRELATKVVSAAELRGICRIDFLAASDDLFVNEVNTIPGSMAAYLWIDPPISRAALFRDLVDEALAMPPRAYSTVGADGTALRNAGTIASKLG